MNIKISNKKINISKMLSYGFSKENDCYVYIKGLLENKFTLFFIVSLNGEFRTKVIDNETNEEYILHLVKNACGAFVGRLRAEYEEAVDSLVKECFDNNVYKTNQAEAIITYIKEKYNNEIEYLWEDENGAVRRADNNKWYVVFLKVKANKFKIESDRVIEVINLKMKPEDVLKYTDNMNYYPAYHMNKKHWISIVLDNSLDTSEIIKRIDESYSLAK